MGLDPQWARATSLGWDGCNQGDVRWSMGGRRDSSRPGWKKRKNEMVSFVYMPKKEILYYKNKA
jgi:hypothetical protein